MVAGLGTIVIMVFILLMSILFIINRIRLGKNWTQMNAFIYWAGAVCTALVVFILLVIVIDILNRTQIKI